MDSDTLQGLSCFDFCVLAPCQPWHISEHTGESEALLMRSVHALGAAWCGYVCWLEVKHLFS